MSDYQGWIDRQIREAQERGEFDNLPGAGKPIEGLGNTDPDWWAKRLIEREQLTMPLPTSLALRKEREDIRQRLADEPNEVEVREIVEDLNARILNARRRAVGGPPVVVRSVDLAQAVEEWREDRAAMADRRRVALEQSRRKAETVTKQGGSKRRWFWSSRGSR